MPRVTMITRAPEKKPVHAATVAIVRFLSLKQQKPHNPPSTRPTTKLMAAPDMSHPNPHVTATAIGKNLAPKKQ